MNSKFRIINIICVLVIIYNLSFITPPAFAANATPSSSIKAKLEELEKEIASKAAKLKLAIKQKLLDKFYFGTITAKSGNSLTVSTKTGPKIITITQDTVYDNNDNPRLIYAYKYVEDGDFVAALGDLDDTDVLHAKKVVLLPKEKSTQETFLWGKIASKSTNQLTVRDRDSKSVNVTLNDKTKFDSEKDKVTFEDLAEFDSVIITGTVNDQGYLEAGYIYVFNKIQAPKTSPVASQSAIPSTKPKGH